LSRIAPKKGKEPSMTKPIPISATPIITDRQHFPELGYTGVLWLGKGGKAGIFQE
jgi:hypothetical protein